MKKIIHATLNELGVPFGLNGRDYIESAVELLLNKGRMGMTTELYPSVAAVFGTKPSRVERDIRHAIEETFSNSDPKRISEFFGNVISLETGKLVNTDFLYGIVKHIQVYHLEVEG